MTISDLTRWLRGDGLEVVLIATGAALLLRLVRWTGDLVLARLERSDQQPETGPITSEAVKHRRSLVQAGVWATNALVGCVTVLLVLERCNVPLTSLVAPATVAGLALGFGAQRVVQDLLAGFFLFAERQYGFGDVVRIAPVGETDGISGTVEELTLRTTRLRTINGEVVVIPNGEIRQVTNLSRDWARVVLDIPVSDAADVAQATALLQKIGDAVASDEEWSPLLLDPPSVMGIEDIAVGFLHVRFVARTLPGKQWEVGRELRRRIAESFRDAGLVVPPSVVAAVPPVKA